MKKLLRTRATYMAKMKIEQKPSKAKKSYLAQNCGLWQVDRNVSRELWFQYYLVVHD